MGGYYEIVVRAHFDAAHRLPGYPGPCARMHGHRWQAEAAVSGCSPGEDGILVDFVTLKAMLGEVVADFDHRCLNEVPPFDTIPPTSENIARFIYQRLSEKIGLPGKEIQLAWVAVAESPETRVVYREVE